MLPLKDGVFLPPLEVHGDCEKFSGSTLQNELLPGTAGDSVPGVLRAKGQFTCFTILSPAMVSVVLGSRDVVPLYRVGN